uniref:H15 domain-containing protein n=1 Tax=Oncorhynchus tshawytscha TaxID=74940 RepID=A0A8C8I3X0_ONCTS
KINNAMHVTTRVSQLIIRVVSQCKHRGGISIVDLKHALAAGGYDVTKNNTRVNLALVHLGDLNSTSRKQIAPWSVERAKQRDHAAVERAKQRKGILKPAAEKGKAFKPTGKALKPGAKTKPAGKSPKPASKDKTVVGKGQREIGETNTCRQKPQSSRTSINITSQGPKKTGYKAPKPAGNALKAANQKTCKMVVTPNTKPRIQRPRVAKRRASLWKWTESMD